MKLNIVESLKVHNALAHTVKVKLDIFNILSQRVAMLVNGVTMQGIM